VSLPPRRSRLLDWSWAATAAAALLACPASAAPCADGGPHLGLEVAASPELRRTIQVDIEVGMRRRGLAVCPDGSTPASRVGRLQIDARNLPEVRITMVDDITDKEVSRRLDLSDLPPDGHSLAIAIAAEELARASWAELALRPRDERPPRRQKKAPAAVRAAVQTQLSEQPKSTTPQPDDNALRLAGSVDHYTTPLTLFGPDVVYRRRLVRWFWLEAGGMFRAGLSAASARGEVDTLAAGGHLALATRAVEMAAFALDFDVGVRAMWIRFDGDAIDGAMQDRFSTWATVARGGASLTVMPTAHLELNARFGAGVPLRAVYATDAGEDVTGIAGAELSTNLGLGVTF